MQPESTNRSLGAGLTAVALLAIVGTFIVLSALSRPERGEFAETGRDVVAANLDPVESRPERSITTLYIVSSSDAAGELTQLLDQQRVVEPPAGGYSIAIAESPEEAASIATYLHGSAEANSYMLAFFPA